MLTQARHGRSNLLRRNVLLAALFSSFVAQAQSQSYIVDASNGAGTQFTSLQAAVNAVPSGATILVRNGVYLSTALPSNKSLRILGASQNGVVVDGISAASLGAQHELYLQDLKIQLGTNLAVSKLRGKVTMRRVAFENTQPTQRATTFTFSECAELHLMESQSNCALIAKDCIAQISNCSFTGGNGGHLGFGFTFPPQPALRVEGGRLQLVASTLQGGNGLSIVFCFASTRIDGTPGEAGLSASGSRLGIYSGTITGGVGSPKGSIAVCRQNAHRGGHGINSTSTSMLIASTTIVGGAGGFGGGAKGNRIVNTRGFVVERAKAAPALHTVSGAVARGNRITLDVTAAPGSRAWLLIGSRPAAEFLEGIGIGHLSLVPDAILGEFRVPANAKLQLPVTLPNTLPRNTPIYTQFFTLEPSPSLVLWASNASVLLETSKF